MSDRWKMSKTPMIRLVATLLWAAMLLPAGLATADDVLLVLRNARISGPHGQIEFDRKALLALPQRTIKTGTDFTTGISTFVGPLASDVIDLIGRGGATRVRMLAVNAFSVEINIDELVKYQAILALSIDGRKLTLRDKGPIWLMYPMDEYPELSDPAYNSRLIWQLRSIDLL